MPGTLIYEVEKQNGVWCATKQLQIENKMVSYDGVAEMKILPHPIPVSSIKDLLSLVYHRSKVFECTLTAPSQIVWTIWIECNETRINSNPMIGRYLKCRDPEEISEEMHQKLMEY